MTAPAVFVIATVGAMGFVYVAIALWSVVTGERAWIKERAAAEAAYLAGKGPPPVPITRTW